MNAGGGAFQARTGLCITRYRRARGSGRVVTSRCTYKKGEIGVRLRKRRSAMRAGRVIQAPLLKGALRVEGPAAALCADVSHRRGTGRGGREWRAPVCKKCPRPAARAQQRLLNEVHRPLPIVSNVGGVALREAHVHGAVVVLLRSAADRAVIAKAVRLGLPRCDCLARICPLIAGKRARDGVHQSEGAESGNVACSD